MGTSNGPKKLKTVETAFDIVEAIQELNGARVTELANHLGMSPSTVHGYLSTLEQHSYLTKEGDAYQIGLQFLNHGGYAQARKPGYGLAAEKVEQLAKLTGERVQFVVENRGRGYYLHTATGENAVKADARIGKRTYLHDSAAGKSILAYSPQEYVERVLDWWGLPKLTEQTITDRAAFFVELENVRERGFALNKEETMNGLHAVGAPVKLSDGNVLGAFSISGPSNRLKGERFEQDLPDMILGMTNELELNLSYI